MMMLRRSKEIVRDCFVQNGLVVWPFGEEEVNNLLCYRAAQIRMEERAITVHS